MKHDPNTIISIDYIHVSATGGLVCTNSSTQARHSMCTQQNGMKINNTKEDTAVKYTAIRGPFIHSYTTPPCTSTQNSSGNDVYSSFNTYEYISTAVFYLGHIAAVLKMSNDVLLYAVCMPVNGSYHRSAVFEDTNQQQQ